MKTIIHSTLTAISLFGLILFIATGVEAMMGGSRSNSQNGGHMMEEHHSDSFDNNAYNMYNGSRGSMTEDKASRLARQYFDREINTSIKMGNIVDRKRFYEIKFLDISEDKSGSILIDKETGDIYQLE